MARGYVTQAMADNFEVGDMVIMPGNGGDMVVVVRDGGGMGGCKTDLYLAYVCMVGDDMYDDTYDDLPYLGDDIVPQYIGR